MRLDVACLLIVTLLTACSRRDEAAGAASTVAHQSTTMANASSTKTRATLSITSAAFANDAPIPAQFTCDGANQSPPLEWDDAPDNAASFALMLEDPDAPGGTFIHWVMYDIPATTRALPQGLPKGPSASSIGGAKQGRTSFKNVGYDGPCPPKGAPHHYHFKLFALDKALGLAPGATRDEVVDAISGHEIARGEIVGTYARKS
jgi:Raf kinase inhibitor-like YbhB/YbcL family protein